MRKILILLVVLVGISSCTDKTKEVNIGLIADLTGSMAMYGNWVKNGAVIAANEINDNNPIKINLIIEDSKSEPKNAVVAVNKLISFENCNTIISGNGSSSVMSVAPIMNKQDALLFVALASSPNISDAGANVFRNRINGIHETKAIVEFSINKNLDRPAALALNNEAGVPYINAFKKELESHGKKLIASELIPASISDMKTQALKFKENKIDVVYLALQSDLAVRFIKQCLEINFNPHWFGISSLKSDLILELPDIVKNKFIVVSESVDSDNALYKKFNTKYKELYNESSDIYSVNGYDAVKILYDLIIKHNSNINMIKIDLNANSFNCAGGIIKFDANGDAIRNIHVYNINNNLFTVIK